MQISQLVADLRRVVQDMQNDRGQLHLVGLFQREEALPDKWDLVVAATWATRSLLTLDYVFSKLRERLTNEELLSLSRIVPLQLNEPFVQSVDRELQRSGGSTEFHNLVLNDVPIAHIHILLSEPDADRETRAAGMAAA